MLRVRIASEAKSHIGKARDEMGLRLETWCGEFVCMVLKNAGLTFEEHSIIPGAMLVPQLSSIEARYALPGDIIHYIGLEHFAIIGEIENGITRRALMIEGNSGPDGKVAGIWRNITLEQFQSVHYIKRQVRSIEPLLHRYEWTGAKTGEVA